MPETVIKPEPQSLFPRKDSLTEALEHIQAQLPITQPNQLHTALMTYHNTLLYVQVQESIQ